MDALDHPKTVSLAAELGIYLPQAIGHLELLWNFIAQKTPQGNIGKWPDVVIANAAQWTGDPSRFVAALVSVGFLDENQEHRLLTHDWAEHMPNWVRAKLKKLGLESFDLSSDLRGHYKGSVGKGSVGNPQDKTNDFDEWWKAYPKKVGKVTVRGIWKRKKLDFCETDLIKDVQKRIELDRKWIEGYIPNPQTYINQERWNDDIEHAKQQAQPKKPKEFPS